MPRTVQTLSQSHRPLRMPDSSTGTAPGSQPAKPITPISIGHRPHGWLERRGRSQLSSPAKRQMFGSGSDDNSSDHEDVTKYEVKKLRPLAKAELASNISTLLKGVSPSHPSFSPKPGSLAEAVTEVKRDIQPIQRGVKWHKEENDSSLSVRNFYKIQSPHKSGPLSEQDINDKVNRTGKFSKKQSKHFYKADEDIHGLVSISEPLKVTVPEYFEAHKIGLENRGMTCYLNSTLQALLGLPMLVTDAINLGRAVQSLSLETIKLVSSFTSLCLAQSKGLAAMTNEMAASVKTDMGCLDEQFTGNEMQDANEFLGRFLDGLKENTRKIFTEVEENMEAREMVVMSENGFTNRLTNLVDTNFMYEKEEEKVCCQCGHKSSSRWTDNNFLLPVDLSGKKKQKALCYEV